MWASLELLPSWALEQKAAVNRQVIAVMRQRLVRLSPACTRSRAWPGWSAKPRPPKRCSPSAADTGADRLIDDRAYKVASRKE